MRRLAKLTWVELKLFIREPVTVFFTLALPIMLLFIMGEVFGRGPADPSVFRGVNAMDYYTPGWIGLVMSAVGLIALPVHLAGYRERGVLRRFRASSLSVWSLVASQVVVTFVISAVCAALLFIASALVYGTRMPESVALLAAAFVLGTLAFAAVGVMLGALLPSPRAAQGIGLLLFFAMDFLSGTAPPREVMSLLMQRVGQAMPLWHVMDVLQDPWLGFGWNVSASLIVTAFAAGAMLVSLKMFRWE